MVKKKAKSKSKVKSKTKPKSKVKSKKKPTADSSSDLQYKQETDPSSVMFSNAWWHYIRENWWKILLKLVLLLIVFFAIYGAVVPLINFQPWFSWWKTNGGNNLQTTNCFSMTSLAYAKGFSLYYYIGSLFGGIQKGISLPKLLILGNLLDTYAIGMQKGGGRYMTPKSLCISIIPDEDVYPFRNPLILNCIGHLKDSSDHPLGAGASWPLGQDIVTWKTIIEFWGGAAVCAEGATITTGDCGKTPSSTMSPYCVDSNGDYPSLGRSHGNANQWYSTGSKYLTKGGDVTNDPSQAASAGPGQGDNKKLNTNYAGNFLWEIYGMPFDSMAIRAFLSGSSNDWNQNSLYPSLLRAAFGAYIGTFQAGGWYGVLQATDSGAGLSEVEFLRAFWAIDEPENLPAAGSSTTAPKSCNASDTVSSVTTGITTTIGIGIMAVFAPEALPFIIPAAILGGGGAAVGSLASSNCL